ncbi:PEP-CTERM sorting domain-containing protein [Poriferisphaera sp. WC338]|uniref:PEP-CTERM sorting domain-containing protein n=1 Tax=Poriferisphaera sp. WC338 TaxID=3425129 RepID=UPI003D813957
MVLKKILPIAVATVLAIGCAMSVKADPVELEVSGTVDLVSGNYVGDVMVGHAINGTFIFDTDEANAAPSSQTTPSNVPGHEFSSFYDFVGAPYGVSLSIPALGGSFNNTGPVGVVVNDDLELTAAETNGMVSDGTYDWIEILGSTTVSICTHPSGTCNQNELVPADGEEWTLAIVTSDTNWITDGSLIPDALPSSYTLFIVGNEFDENGNEVGLVIASASIVPEPASVALLTSMVGIGVFARRRKA